MGCGGSKAKKDTPVQKPADTLLKADATAPKLPNVVVHGMPASMNCLGPILLANASGCGKMQMCIPMQDTMKPEFLAINPFHAVPAVQDADYCLAESNAVLRYMAEAYVPGAYPVDPKLRGFIDWAMDRFSDAMNADAVATIYPILGYAAPPADQAAASKKCVENLDEFAKVFLKNKFIGGEILSIADYKIAPFFFCYAHAALKDKGLVECPDRVRQFNTDFASACGNAAGILTSAGGSSLKEALDKQTVAAPEAAVAPPEVAAPEAVAVAAPEAAAADAPEASVAAPEASAAAPAAAAAAPEAAAAADTKKVDEPPAAAAAGEAAAADKAGCLIYGVTGSMNCMGAILLVTVGGCGKMEMCMPFQGTTTPEFLAINPFHAVPALKDGDTCLAESNTVLRYIAESYVPDAYPKDAKQRGFINWAMDRFSSALSSDAVATIYPILGYAGPPADQAAAGKKCVENLDEFAKVFLKNKFVGGEKPSIADYKIAPFLFCYEHAVLKEKGLVECPERVKQFNKDFAVACGDASGLLTSAGGYSLKEMLDAKLGAVDEPQASADAEPVPEAAQDEAAKEVVREAPEVLEPEAITAPVEVPELVVESRSVCCW